MKVNEIIRDGLHSFKARIRIDGVVVALAVRADSLQGARLAMNKSYGKANVVSVIEQSITEEGDVLKTIKPKANVMRTIKPKPGVIKQLTSKQAAAAVERQAKQTEREVKQAGRVRKEQAKMTDLVRKEVK